MAGRLPNLDPALGGGSHSQRQYPADAYGGTADAYRQEAALPAYTNTATTPAQPYYQYTATSAQNAVPQESPASISTQSPAAHGYVSSHADTGVPMSQTPNSVTDAAGTADDAKRQRACEACRGLKVRCDQDPARLDIPCKRCAKAGRACVITQPSRKRQKKADSRVAELEKKLDALTAALENRHSNAVSASSTQHVPAMSAPSISQAVQASQSNAEHAQTADGPHTAKRKKPNEAYQQHSAEVATTMAIEQPGTESVETKTAYWDMSADDLKRKINALVPLSKSSELFRHYNETMTPYLPMVVFTCGKDPEHIFEEKPILYLAIITAASSVEASPSLPTILMQESMGAIADCVVRNGAKSLELIQAMLIMAAWYKPPERAEQTNFYQIIHMAAVMALDISLPKRLSTRSTQSSNDKQDNTADAQQDSDALEARRAWLGCYYLCATCSMVMRRPNLLRWTDRMRECIDVLETSPYAHPGDKLLCQHVKIQHICEEIGLQFLMDDNTAQVSINDPKVTYALNVLETKLKTWKQQIPAETQCASLTFFEHVTSLYLHEIALHFIHNKEDFRIPFTEESLKSVDSSSDALTQNQIAAIEACLKGAHGILDTMIGFTIDEILALPLLLYFVRCMYAFVILIKMHIAISTPSSELGKLLKDANLKIEYYFDAVIDKLNSGTDLSGAKPEKVLRLLYAVREWFHGHKESTARSESSEEHQTTTVPPNTNAGQGNSTDYNQTPLHMLSQVATGHQDSKNDNHADWTFNRATVFDMKQHAAGHPDSKFPSHQQNIPGNPAYGSNTLGVFEGTGLPGYGWGSGFEQAMDMTMGHMGDLQGSGLDSWFLGGNVAPFGFNDPNVANTHEGTGQWQ